MSRLARVWIRQFVASPATGACVSLRSQNVARLEEKRSGDETEMKCQMPATTHMNLGRRKDGVLFITRPASRTRFPAHSKGQTRSALTSVPRLEEEV